MAGKGSARNSFCICLNYAEGPPPSSIFGVLKSLSIRRPIYKPNDTWHFGIWTEQGFEKCCREKEKPGQNGTHSAFKKASIYF